MILISTGNSQDVPALYRPSPDGVLERPRGYEFEAFSSGTNGVARAIASAAAISVVGSGDSLAVVYNLGLQNDRLFPPGCCPLEFLEGSNCRVLKAAASGNTW